MWIFSHIYILQDVGRYLINTILFSDICKYLKTSQSTIKTNSCRYMNTSILQQIGAGSCRTCRCLRLHWNFTNNSSRVFIHFSLCSSHHRRRPTSSWQVSWTSMTWRVCETAPSAPSVATSCPVGRAWSVCSSSVTCVPRFREHNKPAKFGGTGSSQVTSCTTQHEIENLYSISQKFDLRLRLRLGLGRFYAVLDRTHVNLGTSTRHMMQSRALGKPGRRI